MISGCIFNIWKCYRSATGIATDQNGGDFLKNGGAVLKNLVDFLENLVDFFPKSNICPFFSSIVSSSTSVAQKNAQFAPAIH